MRRTSGSTSSTVRHRSGHIQFAPVLRLGRADEKKEAGANKPTAAEAPAPQRAMKSTLERMP